ncbi:MAG: hypothetical protein AB1847_09915 [bacterium]
MNKKGFWKVLMVSLVMASAIGLMASGAIAQNIPTQLQLREGKGQQVGGTIVLDNFQYWNSPRDQGWKAYEPAYPIWGAGIGLGIYETVVDFQEGSRVLEVHSNPSVFLPMGGNQYMPFTITKDANYFDAGNEARKGIPGAFSTMSLNLRAPLSVEWFDTFRVIVRVRVIADVTPSASGMIDIGGGDLREVPLGADDICGTPVALGLADIIYYPRETQVGCTPDNGPARITKVDQPTIRPAAPATGFVHGSPEVNVYTPNGEFIAAGANGEVAQPSRVWVALGREFQDGSWHMIMEDLDDIIAALSNNAEHIFEIVSVTVRGNQYRMDDLMFTAPAASIANNNAPYLFRIGPVYGQLFNVNQTRYVFAEDIDLLWLFSDQALLIKAQNDPDLTQQLSGLPAGCRLAQRLQTVNPANPPDFPFIEDATGLTPGQAGFDAATAMFVNPVVTPAPAAGAQSPALFPAGGAPSLTFKFTVGDALGSVSSMGQPVPLPATVADVTQAYMRSMPPQLPAMDVATRAWVSNNGAAAVGNPMYALVCAMVNSGYRVWPTIQMLRPSAGQVFEDLIVTCRVEDINGVADMETFPVSVVNYPVTNLPPLIEQLEDKFFPTNETSVYQITATDPDFADMANGLTYKATLNGLPNYQYGPWMEQIINPITGTISLTPQFEGALTCTITVTDPRGAQAVGYFNIFCIGGGTWLNHPPAVLEIIESPQVVKAGQAFIISDLRIADPDGQQLYYSCNIGAVGRNGIYRFQSEFPGEYLVQITAYDNNGAAVTQQFVLQVLPFWSY